MNAAKRIALGFHFSIVGMFLTFIDKAGEFGLLGLALIFVGLVINLIGYSRND